MIKTDSPGISRLAQAFDSVSRCVTPEGLFGLVFAAPTAAGQAAPAPASSPFRRPGRWTAVTLAALLAGCASQPWHKPLPTTWAGTHALMRPPARVPIPADAVDPSDLTGKLMVGYQGWAVADGDGSGLGWTHYGVSRGAQEQRYPLRFEPGAAVIDLWPDMQEASRSERYPTPFHLADGSTAFVPTARNPATIDRHFRWMRDYGIDGIFLQRFVHSLSKMPLAAVHNEVLAGVRRSAARYGRTWAIMYDLTGCRASTVERLVREDWQRLVDEGRIRDDPRLQRYHGKPLVAVWGVGFARDRQYTLAECDRLIRWLKCDPVYGGNAVMLGVPYHWREQTNDATSNPDLHRVLAQADVLSPWAVGRLHTPKQARASAAAIVAADRAWTAQHGCEYMPVIFPGFSWHNQERARGREAPLNAIPRHGGEFYRAIADGTLAGGATMLYVAMFDEIDEGTAIMKTSQNPPVGQTPFVSEPRIPPDQYLRITGEIRQRLRERVAGRVTGQPVSASLGAIASDANTHRAESR